MDHRTQGRAEHALRPGFAVGLRDVCEEWESLGLRRVFSLLLGELAGEADAGDVAIRVFASRFLAAGPFYSWILARARRGGEGSVFRRERRVFGNCPGRSTGRPHGRIAVEFSAGHALPERDPRLRGLPGQDAVPLSPGRVLSAPGRVFLAGGSCGGGCGVGGGKRGGRGRRATVSLSVRRMGLVSGHVGPHDRPRAGRPATDGRPLYVFSVDRCVPDSRLAVCGGGGGSARGQGGAAV